MFQKTDQELFRLWEMEFYVAVLMHSQQAIQRQMEGRFVDLGVSWARAYFREL